MRIPRPLLHTARYLLTAAVGWLVYPLQVMALYAVMLLATIALDGDPGGPFFVIVALAVAAVGGAVLMLAVILPATLVGELVARRLPWPGLRWAFAPLLAGVVAFVLSLAAVAVWAALTDAVLMAVVYVWGLTVVLSVLPFAATAATAYGLAIAPPILRWVRQRLARFRVSLGVKRLDRADPGSPAGG